MYSKSVSTEGFRVSLPSEDHTQLLNIVDKLRSLGISNDIPLPQIIVCGDQSSGKSSVLEAVSGVRFPMKDNLCTRFATELILRRETAPSVKVAIIPGPRRTEEEKQRLLEFRSPSLHVDDFPDLVDSAKEFLGMGANTRTAFSDDVLRVEISGPEQPHLTLVDLPGVIHSDDKEQSAEDVDLVMELVRRYMRSSRSIILAVVSAKNDCTNQIVTKLAREFDPLGTRTLGIITKPDTLDAGSESERKYFELAKNENVEFRLGWHVLRNRDYSNRECSVDERNAREKEFLSTRVWKSLKQNIKGIQTLKTRLSVILKEHIMVELPNLVQDVQSEIETCKEKLRQLGEERGTPRQQRRYLLKTSQSFTILVKAAVKGDYSDNPGFFGDPMTDLGFKKRLRAFATDLQQNFADDMRTNGQYEKVVDDVRNQKELPPGVIQESEYLRVVRELMKRTRGCEISGVFDPSIIGDLFRRQSQVWEDKINTLVDRTLSAVKTFLELALDDTTSEMVGEAILRQVINPCFEIWSSELKEKISELVRVHRHGRPITYNHYFTETIQKARQAVIEQQLLPALQLLDDNHSRRFEHVSSDKIMRVFRTKTEPNLDLFACKEAFICMKAYYKVVMKILIDDVAKLAIEQCLLDRLPTIFTPNSVADFEDDLVKSIATESETSRLERADLTEKLQNLEQGLLALRRVPQCKRSQLRTYAMKSSTRTERIEYASEIQDSRCSTLQVSPASDTTQPTSEMQPGLVLSDDDYFD